jgi:hypothetical protein
LEALQQPPWWAQVIGEGVNSKFFDCDALGVRRINLLGAPRSVGSGLIALLVAQVKGKRGLELAECALVFFGPSLRRGLQRFQELTLLLVVELEILAGRGEPAAVSLGLDPLRDAAGRLRGVGSVLELGYQRSRCVL